MEDPLQSWEAQLRTYALPEWDNLPELELYMDQVVLLLSRYLTFFSQGEDEKIITPSIVNNYVRMKIMPPPNKKRYGRTHIAYLLMICTLKQSLSIAAIQKLLPLELDGARVDRKFVKQIMEMLGIAEKKSSLPGQLSGGQQQRVAIARALASKPSLILADEPTGNLDSRTSQEVMGLLKLTGREFHQTIVMITHNEALAQLCDRIIRIEDGRIVPERGQRSYEK